MITSNQFMKVVALDHWYECQSRSYYFVLKVRYCFTGPPYLRRLVLPTYQSAVGFVQNRCAPRLRRSGRSPIRSSVAEVNTDVQCDFCRSEKLYGSGSAQRSSWLYAVNFYLRKFCTAYPLSQQFQIVFLLVGSYRRDIQMSIFAKLGDSDDHSAGQNFISRFEILENESRGSAFKLNCNSDDIFCNCHIV